MTGIVGFLGDGYVLYQCKSICRSFGIDTIRFENSDDVLNEYCDVLFVFRYKKILSESILNAPPEGCIMTHYSELPKYRGFYPINQAIRNGATEIGITMFYGDVGIDTGDIICQRVIPVDINSTIDEIYIECDYVAIDMFRSNILHIMKDTASRTPQPAVDSRPRTANELPGDIDLSRFSGSVKYLHNFIRSRTGAGQEPAYIEDDEYRLYFEKTRLVKK